MNNNFLCPVCRRILTKEIGSFKCINGHCFDLSRYGYVNLLTKGGKKGHGDDKLMVNARRNFLSKNYYGHLKAGLCEEIKKYISPNISVLDSGCGDGYYTKGIYDAVSEDQSISVYGIDVSKEAVKIAASACPNVHFAVASAYCLPFENKSIDILFSVFAPFARDEFKRILKNNGIFITVIPLENHLFSLKKAVYDTPYKNRPEPTELDGFTLINSSEVKKEITLTSRDDINDLFKMTPYYYKTSARDQKKLDHLDKLNVETEFMILTYKKSY